MTRAEAVVDALVSSFHKDMLDPSMRGDRFNPATFNIERWVDCHLFLYYARKGHPRLVVRQRALLRARKLWNKLWNIKKEHYVGC